MSEISEKLNRHRSRTPCLDENREEDENCAEDLKEIELSDISDEDDDQQWQVQLECNSKNDSTNGNPVPNANGSRKDQQSQQQPQRMEDKESAFKKITRSNRDRNYRDNVGRRREYGENEFQSQQNRFSHYSTARTIDHSRRKEIERYDVRKVVASRDFSISRSRSRSFSPPPLRNRVENFPRREYRRSRSISQTLGRQEPSVRYSPLSLSPQSRHSSFSPSPRYKNKHQYESQRLLSEATVKRRRSRSRQARNKSAERMPRRKKHKSSKDPRKHKKDSRSKSRQRSSTSLSPDLAPASSRSAVAKSLSPTPRQIMANSNLPQENIKIILKNDDAFAPKRQKIKKRDKKNKKEKASRKDVLMKEKSSSQRFSKEQQQTKEVFASGDNILISVCFNNNNNHSNKNNHNNNNSGNTAPTAPNVISNSSINSSNKNDHNTKSLKPDVVDDRISSNKNKTKRKPVSPVESLSSVNSAYDKSDKRQKRHKRKKSKKSQGHSKPSPQTPPMKPSIAAKTTTSVPTKRKSDMKPIAIIDLEKSPGKEITQSPKEVIILSDSEGETRKREIGSSKDIVIIEDTILDKGNHSPTHATPESPPPAAPQPVLKFALKAKSNILPFNLLHDQAEENEDSNAISTSNVTLNDSQQVTKNTSSSQKEQLQQQSQLQDVNASNVIKDDKNVSNQNEAYDPFEPTKSRSPSPVTPPPPPYEPVGDLSSKSGNISSSNNNNISSNKLEPFNEKSSTAKDLLQIPGLSIDDHQTTTTTASSSSSLWNKKSSQQPTTPPLPPSGFAFTSSSLNVPGKPHVSLYDGIYGTDLKTPVNIKSSNIKSSLAEKNKNGSKNNANTQNDDDDDDDDRTPYSPSSDGYDYEPPPTTMHPSKNNFDSMKHSDLDTQSSEPSGSYSFDDTTASKIVAATPLKLTTSTLKSFNSSMRTSSSGLQFVNKAELSIFENYLPASQQKSPLVKRQSNSSFIRAKMSRFASSMNENGSPLRNAPYSETIQKPPVIDESILDDEVPSSAVDLINKDKFLKKSLRIERVAEEVKLVLKPHYNKKHITKEEYKEILRKSVPKICHNKTGEINIQKITQLIEAYIKKVRYKRKSGVASSI